MKKAGIALVVIALIVSGLFVAKGPQPEIIVPAEVITKVGFLNISNTMIAAWLTIAFLAIVTFLATRSISLVPGRMQNFLEAVIEFLVNQCENIAGKAHGRRMFTVVATIFLFLITANWFGLLPFFNAIGKTEDVAYHVFHELAAEHPHDLELAEDGTYATTEKFGAWVMEDAGGAIVVKPGSGAIDFEVERGHTPGESLDRFIVFLAKHFADLENVGEEELLHPSDELVSAAAARLESTPNAPKLMTSAPEGEEDAHGLTSPVLGQDIYGIDFDQSDKKMMLVIPAFRSVYSDVNNTLAMGIVAFLAIEFWGFQALGFGYLKKFFNLNGINSFVGILELLSEFIRVISFTFRLFGNIFAGEVLILMLTFLMPFVIVDVIYGLELFVGFIQAAVFALLVLVFGSMAMIHHGDGHEESHGEPDNEGTARAHH